MKNFKDKTAAVTGAASGIGRACSLLLASKGCSLAITDVNSEGLSETAELASEYGVKVTQYKVDVSDRPGVFKFAEDTVKDHGRVNLLMNNAGVSLTAGIESMTEKDMNWLMDINFWGVVYGTQAFLPHLKKADEAVIVNVASAFSLMGMPSQAAYCASKYAVRGFTETLQQELEVTCANVRAMCVHPGGIKTNIVHNSRIDGFAGAVQDRNKMASKFDRIAMTTPEKAAEDIIRGLEKNKLRVLIGSDARMIDRLQRLMPSGYQSVMLNKNGAFKRMRKKLKSQK